RLWAQQAFNHTANYDVHVANYFNGLQKEDNAPQLNVALPKNQALRYGENPHQKAAVYGSQQNIIDCFHGKGLSYNNFLDIDAALHLIADFKDEKPACGILKHTVPCGVAISTDLTTAWGKAFATDTSSPYGGIVVVNKELDLETAKAIDKIFTELILAPSFAPDAEELLRQKKNRRLVRIKKMNQQAGSVHFRSIFGGAISQESDTIPVDPSSFEIPTRRKPSERE